MYCGTDYILDLYALISYCLAGAGVAIENSGQGLPNNSAIVVDGGLELSCRSGALTAGVGDLIGVDGRFLLANVSFSAIYLGTLSIWRKTTFNTIQIRHSTTAPDLAAEEEGVYTCRMPDENGKTIDVNFGLYRRQLPGNFYRVDCTIIE